MAQVVQPGRHNRLLPKIYVNLGITQEADGRLHAACNNYRSAFHVVTSTLLHMSGITEDQHQVQHFLARFS